MIVTRTPLRISFFGGGSDLNYFLDSGHHSIIVGGSVNKYIYNVIKVSTGADFDQSRYRIGYREVEQVDWLDDIKHRPIREALRKYNLKNGVELHHIADLPAKTGLGSSSAFTNGLILGLEYISGQNPSTCDLAKKSIHFEQRVLNEHVGCQDQILTALGGFNILRIEDSVTFEARNLYDEREEFIKMLNQWLVVCFTGIKRSADTTTKAQVSRGADNFSALKDIVSIAEEAVTCIEAQNLLGFAELLNISWETKKSLHSGVSNPTIDDLINHGLKHGAIGSKLLGAGAGGFVAFLVPPERQQSFKINIKADILDDLWFENEGATRVYP